MKSKYSFRKANTGDIQFLASIIIEAEKSLTDKFGLSNIFEISEVKMTEYLVTMLEQEIDGCEFSTSSYILACFENQPIAALGGWIEGLEEALTSSQIKSSLLSFTIPNENILKAKEKTHSIKDLNINRGKLTYQLEYAFVNENHRGNYLINQLIEKHIELLKYSGVNIKKIQAQVYGNNKTMILTYKLSDFSVQKKFRSSDPVCLNYLPYNEKILMEKNLNY